MKEGNESWQAHMFSKEEEISNSITHGIGVILSIAALVILIVFASLYGNVWHVVSFTLFGVTMLLLYTSSTLLHALKPGKAKDFFEIMDHSSIYFFIAGSYTPFFIGCRAECNGLDLIWHRLGTCHCGNNF